MKALFLGFFVLLALAFSSAMAQETRATNGCAKACAIHADCGVGAFCDEGSCRYRPQFCVSDLWSAKDSLQTQSCGGYKCNFEIGACREESHSSEECTAGFVNDGNGACVPSVSCDESEAACADLKERWNKEREEYEKSLPEPVLPPYTCASQSYEKK